jgi:hypothetical protein
VAVSIHHIAPEVGESYTTRVSGRDLVRLRIQGRHQHPV